MIESRKLLGKSINMTGIIGQNGKSTIAHMIHHCYHALEIESEISRSAEILKKINQKSYEKKVKDVIIEVCQRDIREKRVGYLDFDTLILTNTGENNDTDDIWTMKRPFIALPINKTAVINIDDEKGVDFCNMTIASTVTYGMSELANIRATDIQLTPTKTHFDLHYQGTFIFRAETPYFGLYNLYNTLATIAHFTSEGYDAIRIAKLLPELPPLEGRYDTFVTDSNIRVVVDCAKNFEAVKAILTSLKEICSGRIITVIGADGGTTRHQRQLIGGVALSYSDQVVITSDDPQDVEPQEIIYDMIKSTFRQNYRLCIDREKAIEVALKLAKPNDIVVILGKGHIKTQIIKDKTLPFCDNKTVAYLTEKFEI